MSNITKANAILSKKDEAKSQKEVLTQLQSQFPEQFEEHDGELFRITELTDYKPWVEMPELEELDGETQGSLIEGIDLTCLRVEGSPFYLSANVSTFDGGEEWISCVYFNLNKDILGHVRRIVVPAEFSGKQDEEGNKLPTKHLAMVKLAGEEFDGGECEETGLPTKVRFAYSGIYLPKATRRWLFNLRQEVADMDDNGSEFQQLATICNVLSKCPVS